MIECKDCCALMDQELTDILSAEEKNQLQEHLAECPSCRERMDQLKGFFNDLSPMQEEVPEAVHEEILLALEKERNLHMVQKPHKTVRPYFTMVAAVAILLLLVVNGAFGDLFRWFNHETVSNAKDESSTEIKSSLQTDTSGIAKAFLKPNLGANSDKAAETAQHTVTIAGVTVALPDEAVEQSYGFVVLVLYKTTVPDIADGTLLQTSEDQSTYFYTIENNMEQLEKLTSALEKKGCKVEVGQKTEVSLNEKASTGLIIAYKE